MKKNTSESGHTNFSLWFSRFARSIRSQFRCTKTWSKLKGLPDSSWRCDTWTTWHISDLKHPHLTLWGVFQKFGGDGGRNYPNLVVINVTTWGTHIIGIYWKPPFDHLDGKISCCIGISGLPCGRVSDRWWNPIWNWWNMLNMLQSSKPWHVFLLVGQKLLKIFPSQKEVPFNSFSRRKERAKGLLKVARGHPHV